MNEKMKAYKTTHWSNGVEEIEAERWSENSVWIKGRRNAINNSYQSYHKTKEEALNAIRERLESKVSSLRRQYKDLPASIAQAESKLQKFLDENGL